MSDTKLTFRERLAGMAGGSKGANVAQFTDKKFDNEDIQYAEWLASAADGMTEISGLFAGKGCVQQNQSDSAAYIEPFALLGPLFTHGISRYKYTPDSLNFGSTGLLTSAVGTHPSARVSFEIGETVLGYILRVRQQDETLGKPVVTVTPQNGEAGKFETTGKVGLIFAWAPSAELSSTVANAQSGAAAAQRVIASTASTSASGDFYVAPATTGYVDITGTNAMVDVYPVIYNKRNCDLIWGAFCAKSLDLLPSLLLEAFED